MRLFSIARSLLVSSLSLLSIFFLFYFFIKLCVEDIDLKLNYDFKNLKLSYDFVKHLRYD